MSLLIRNPQIIEAKNMSDSNMNFFELKYCFDDILMKLSDVFRNINISGDKLEFNVDNKRCTISFDGNNIKITVPATLEINGAKALTEDYNKRIGTQLYDPVTDKYTDITDTASLTDTLNTILLDLYNNRNK